MSSRPQPGWYADPAGASDLRWWDGDGWTDAVVLAGVQARSPLPGAGAGAAAGTGTLFSEPVLVVRTAPPTEPTDGYAVYDQAGRPLGSVVEVGRSGLRTALRFVPRLDRYLARRLEVRDAAGVPQLLVTRPPELVRSRVVVARPGGGEIGRLVRQDGSGLRIGLLSGGRPVGALLAQSRQAGDLTVVDDTGAQVARIRTTLEGMAQAVLLTADHYVVQILRPLSDPLRSLVVAGALTVGTALEQDVRGLA